VSAQIGSDRGAAGAQTAPAPLLTGSRPPAECFDVALLDLDGVVYLVRDPVPGAAAALAAARDAGMRLAFVTNNASRSPDDVVALLREVGVKADPAEVVTSAQAAGRVLAERLAAGARVLVVGSAELQRQVADHGLVAVESADDSPQAVVCGYAPEVGWRQLAEAAIAVGRGAYWLATNVDTTLPSLRGPLPGNGALMSVITTATGLRPDVAGKPDPALHRESVERTEARRPIVVGDRLDTDIEGASRVGCPSMLVLSGVSTPADLLAAPPEHRPTFLADDVGGLLTEQLPVRGSAELGWACGRWRAERRPDGSVGLAADSSNVEGDSGADRLDALRVASVASWAASDDRGSDGRGADGRGASLVADGEPAAQLLTEWGLPAG
jgi:HAD superfamily hydrolase (TIGR01450 family)